eukprot:4930819-Prymnesium_polylepis.2
MSVARARAVGADAVCRARVRPAMFLPASPSMPPSMHVTSCNVDALHVKHVGLASTRSASPKMHRAANIGND